jgi:hypothetical protein
MERLLEAVERGLRGEQPTAPDAEPNG